VEQTSFFNPAPEAEHGAGEDEDYGDDDKGKDRGCRCGRTKCLKQYCQCFRNDVRCSEDCVCDDCHNDGRHEEKRIDAIRRIRMNNPLAFKGTDLEIEDQEVRTPRGTLKVIRGCRCKRSKCRKKYCECYGAGLACSTNCVCKDCQNGNADAGNINDVSEIMKHSKTPVQPRARKIADSESDEEAAYAEVQAEQNKSQRLKILARVPPSVSTLPSQNTQKHPAGRAQPQHQASQRPPPAQEARVKSENSGAHSPSSMGGKKSFRRNDLKVGVPVPTYVQNAPILGEADSVRMAVVTPHGSIHLPNAAFGNARSSPRLSLLGTPSTTVLLVPLAPLPGAGFRREESSPRLQWGQLPSASRRSASPRWPQNSPAMMREDSQWDSGPGFGLLRNDSLLQEQYSPLSGEMKSPTMRSRRDTTQLNSARESERDSLGSGSGLFPGGGAMAAMGGGASSLTRRSSIRSGGGLLSAGPFGRNTPPLSPLVTDGGWSGVGLLSDPTQEPPFF